MEQTASDRYRIQVFRGSLFRGLRSKKAGTRVAIVDAQGVVVWERNVTSTEMRPLVDLIQEQVLTARVQDFEHWLRTEGRREP